MNGQSTKVPSATKGSGWRLLSPSAKDNETTLSTLHAPLPADAHSESVVHDTAGCVVQTFPLRVAAAVELPTGGSCENGGCATQVPGVNFVLSY